MARRSRPSGRFFVYSALTALAVVLAVDRVKDRATGIPMPAGRTRLRAPG